MDHLSSADWLRSCCDSGSPKVCKANRLLVKYKEFAQMIFNTQIKNKESAQNSEISGWNTFEPQTNRRIAGKIERQYSYPKEHLETLIRSRKCRQRESILQTGKWYQVRAANMCQSHEITPPATSYEIQINISKASQPTMRAQIALS